MVEMITVKRIPAGRATGSKITGAMLLEMAKLEKPYMKPVVKDYKDNEYWTLEKQWWLKHKKEFQDLGFLPLSSFNHNKKIHQMMEKY